MKSKMFWLLKEATMFLSLFYCVNCLTTQSYYDITKDWIISVAASSVIGVYNASRSSHCTWQCTQQPDCFAVNVIHVDVSYTCELLPAVVSVYSFQQSPGAVYYRKPCRAIAGTADQIKNDKGDVHYALFEVLQSYEEAIASCNSYGMKLVALETEDEYDMVVSTLTTAGGIWLAAYEVGDTDTFSWINHDALLSYYHWGQGEPNSWYNQEHCINVNTNLKMVDYTFSLSQYYICECPYVR